jgi:Uncharacterised nucleotidyltransferase
MALHSGSSGTVPLLRILSGAWRVQVDPEGISESDLETAAPLLLATGTAALAWHKLSTLQLESSPFFQKLEEAYRLHSIHSAVLENKIKDVFSLLRAGGVEPLLLKGWAVARWYPQTGLRPSGDIDLWVKPAELTQARKLLEGGNDLRYWVDLHASFYEQYERTVTDVLAQSQLAELDGVEVRVPRVEDHLRYLCLHFLTHGAWRPLWLCDIALIVESRPGDFDWSRCLGTTPRYADWIACVIGLAHRLLDADISGVPVADRARNLPRWLVPAVLQQWEAGAGMSYADKAALTVQAGGLRPQGLMTAWREHWRNPIQATVELSAAFDERPRAPLQLAAGLKRLPKFTRDLIRNLRHK